MNTIKQVLFEGDNDFNGNIITEDRFIILDSEGFDLYGEHFSKSETINLLNK